MMDRVNVYANINIIVGNGSKQMSDEDLVEALENLIESIKELDGEEEV